MPLIIDTKLNDNTLGWLKISRLEYLTGTENEHTYMARSATFQQGTTKRAPTLVEATFKHTYSDGYQVCVAKAMLAIAEASKK